MFKFNVILYTIDEFIRRKPENKQETKSSLWWKNIQILNFVLDAFLLTLRVLSQFHEILRVFNEI